MVVMVELSDSEIVEEMRKILQEWLEKDVDPFSKDAHADDLTTIMRMCILVGMKSD